MNQNVFTASKTLSQLVRGEQSLNVEIVDELTEISKFLTGIDNRLTLIDKELADIKVETMSKFTNLERQVHI